MSIEVTLNTLSTLSIPNSAKIKSILEEACKSVEIVLEDISWLDQWEISKETHNISHVSGKFFSIVGIHQKKKSAQLIHEQAIINQPEIGLLGLIVRERDDHTECLVQAKMEPGNINLVQLSPTLQATYSNYTSVHKGKKPLFLDFFLDNKTHKIIKDILQPEQTHKFYKKNNRNIVVQVDTEFEIPDSFMWLKFDDLKKLQLVDNLVNMDLRSILSSIRDSIEIDSFDLFSQNEIDHWIKENVKTYECEIRIVDLKNIPSCVYDKGIIKDTQNAFEVIGIHVRTNLREVSEWSQPLVRVPNQGMYGFITSRINGVVHFLVRFHPNVGTVDNIELTTTFDSLDASSMILYEEVINRDDSKIIFKCLQSEEGGRFYHYVNENVLLEIPDYSSLTLDPRHKWLSFNQVHHFLNKGYFSMEARSIFSIYNESQ